LANERESLDLLDPKMMPRISKSFMTKRSSEVIPLQDATDYYKKYNDEGDNSTSNSFTGDLIGECYIGFPKLI